MLLCRVVALLLHLFYDRRVVSLLVSLFETDVYVTARTTHFLLEKAHFGFSIQPPLGTSERETNDEKGTSTATATA